MVGHLPVKPFSTKSRPCLFSVEQRLNIPPYIPIIYIALDTYTSNFKTKGVQESDLKRACTFRVVLNALLTFVMLIQLFEYCSSYNYGSSL